MKHKILFFEDLIKKVSQLRRKGKVVVQSHGIFDLIHPGVIQHINSAKGQGDVLVVTVVKDKDVHRGPGRPIFNEQLRAENIASLSQVDFVCLVDNEIPFDCVRRIKPDIFARGQAYKERDGMIHQRIYKEEKDLYFGKTKIYETDGCSFSSTQIIKDFFEIYPDETKQFLKRFAKRYSFSNVVSEINKLQKLKVLLIGDGIIDEYFYCEALGKSTKSHLIVDKYLSHETFAGGAFAIANHIAGLCDEVCLVSLLGATDSREEFIQSNLRPNVQKKFFYRTDGPTIVKRRYLDLYLNQKLFEIDYLNNSYIDHKLETEIIEFLGTTISRYDLILISDFGHGFITNKIIKYIKQLGIKFAVNTQTNGANIGYNLVTKYHSPSFVCLDESEVRLAAQDRYGYIEDVAKKIVKLINSEYIIITRGKTGSLGIGKKGEINYTPIFSTTVIDTIGAGDAFFSFTAPCIAIGLPLDLVSFIGNVAGALAVRIVCNKRPVEKHEFLEFVHALLK